MALAQETKNAIRAAVPSPSGAQEVIDNLEAVEGLSNTELGYLDGVTPGTVTASKALVVDANKDIATIRDLTGRNLKAGTAGSTQGTVVIAGATSGTVTLAVAAAAGGITLTLPSAVGSNGQQLTTDGATPAVLSWAAAGSMREFKNVLAEVSDRADAVLSRIMGTGVYDFQYKNAEGAITTRDFDTVYTGVMAEELPEVMHHDGKIFNPVSAFGELVLCVKALANKISRLETAVQGG